MRRFERIYIRPYSTRLYYAKFEPYVNFYTTVVFKHNNPVKVDFISYNYNSQPILKEMFN
jgi:hypothetical protein